MMGIKSSIYKISLILIAIILLPVIFYSIYQIATLNKNEKMISRIYEQQLDAILFSVNQYLWDNLTTWQSRIRRIQADTSAAAAEYRTIVNEVPPLEMLAFSDSLLNHWRFFIKSDYHGEKNLFHRIVVDGLKKDSNLVKQMGKYHKVKYSKVESLSFIDPAAGQREKLILYYLADIKDTKTQFVYLLIDIGELINTILAPKIDEIAGAQFNIAVFSTTAQRLIYENAAVDIKELKQTRAVWLLPNYKLGISLRGESIEELARGRFYINMLMILGIDLILLLGAWIVFKMIRQQMQLAHMKSDFVSNVSHELRTPLALIRMYAETLELGRIPEIQKQQEYYRIIRQESERLSRLINNILNFSRIEAGKKEYHFQEVDLNRLIQNLLEMYSYHIASKGFKLSVILDPSVPRIIADEEAVTEALLNLLDNAIKYSAQEKFIAVRSLQRDGKACIQVEDHGIGIEASQTRYIFEKFYRVSHNLVHNTKGSGLGLTLVKHIMDAHHGRVELKSTPGKGSCFSLIFTATT
jgi:two-component system phosphate regulon sensor histidine kinase PhoR